MADMEKVTVESIDEGMLDEVLNSALTQTVSDVAGDPSLHDDSHSDDRDDSWRVSRHCLDMVEKSLGVEFDEDSTRWLHSVIYHDLYDNGHWTTPEARQTFIEEAYRGMRDAKDSERWREVVDMLRKYHYFDNVSVTDILANRDYGHYESDAIRNHGITIGWDLSLVNGWGRLGIDSEWNKVRDATILLYWPGVDSMGYRRWEAIRGTIESVLDPSSEEHHQFVRHWGRCHDDYKVDMHPLYGADA